MPRDHGSGRPVPSFEPQHGPGTDRTVPAGQRPGRPDRSVPPGRAKQEPPWFGDPARGDADATRVIPERPGRGRPVPGGFEFVGQETRAERPGQETRAERFGQETRAERLGTQWATAEPETERPARSSSSLTRGLRLTGFRSASDERPGQGRGAFIVTGVLGAVVVLAIGLVAVSAMRGSSGKAAAANVSQPSLQSTSAPSSITSAKAAMSASPKASASSASPTTSASATKSAATSNASKTKSPSANPSASTQAATAPLSVPAGWKLTFDPSFSGSSLDTSTWATCYDWATSPSVGCTNNPTKEKEWYVPSQVSVSGGTLNLTAKQEATQGLSSSGSPETYSCRSGMVTSLPGFSFTYGLISITAKIPYGTGLWPALWLAASSGQWPPELDIMEHWHSEQQAKVYDHTIGTSYLGGAVPTPGNLSAGYNTYSLLWTKDRVTWYLDGTEVFTATSYVPSQAMYFIADVADDSTAAGACNGTMQISSVKVWQP